jgi:putative PEP-CTERM system histidine kinase
VVMSGAARRRLQVFLHKHFYRNKFDYRVEWLRFVSTLSAPAQEDIRETSVKAMAQVFQSPSGVLYARAERDGRFEPVAAWPVAVRDMHGLQALTTGDELLQFMRSSQWVVDLREYARSPELYQNIAVPEWLRQRRGSRVISPLLQDAEMVGFVLLDEPPPPFRLTYEDRDLLKIMGRHVALVLTRNAAERRLTESRAFEAYNRLTAFMMHDLKNAIAQLNLVVSNAQRHRNNPRFVDDAFETVANAAARMTGLMEQLRRPDQAGPQEELDIREAVQEAVRRCSDRHPVPRFAPPLPETQVVLRLRAERSRLINVLEHVMRNAQDASPHETVLEVRVTPDGRGALIEVQDQGSGMTPEFVRDRLFRPFDSTKGAKGMGIGAYQVLEYVRLLGGDVEVRTSPGKGTTFGIKLPVLAG